MTIFLIFTYLILHTFIEIIPPGTNWLGQRNSGLIQLSEENILISKSEMSSLASVIGLTAHLFIISHLDRKVFNFKEILSILQHSNFQLSFNFKCFHIPEYSFNKTKLTVFFH